MTTPQAGYARLDCFLDERGNWAGGEYRTICAAIQTAEDLWEVCEPEYTHMDGSGRWVEGVWHDVTRAMIKKMPVAGDWWE